MVSVPEVAVVVLAYGAEPTLAQCIDHAIRSTDVELDIVVVDNGANPDELAKATDRPGVRVVSMGRNLGFAGGCNFGVDESIAPFVMLLNSDAFVRPAAIRLLVDAVSRPGVGIASAGLRLAQDPERMNSIGNPVHFSGMTWSGGFGESADRYRKPGDIPSATGAAMIVERATWEALSGFDEEYFAYLEDTDLSMRTWQHGLAVVFVPDAVVLHQYEFSRNALKMFLLERNRLLYLCTTYQSRTLVILGPGLLLVELALVVQSLVGGWFPAKARGWWWIMSHGTHVRERRRCIQNSRSRTDRQLKHLWCGRIEPANIALPPGFSIFNALLACYWKLAAPWI